jgi:hypothetical protein
MSLIPDRAAFHRRVRPVVVGWSSRKLPPPCHWHDTTVSPAFDLPGTFFHRERRAHFLRRCTPAASTIDHNFFGHTAVMN